MNSLFESGNLSQEMGGVIGTTPEPNKGYNAMATGHNLFVDCDAELRNVCNVLEGNSALQNKFRFKFLSLVSEMHAESIDDNPCRMNEGEFVSINAANETETVCKRRKNRNEPDIDYSTRRKKASKTDNDNDVGNSYIMDV